MTGLYFDEEALSKALKDFTRDCYIKPDRIHIIVPRCLKADSVQVTWGLLIKCEERLSQSKVLIKLGEQFMREWND